VGGLPSFCVLAEEETAILLTFSVVTVRLCLSTYNYFLLVLVNVFLVYTSFHMPALKPFCLT
jgi:hypothetical protein